MEPEPSAPTRKVRFAPKIPTRKAPKSTVPKTEVVDESEAAAKELLRRVNENAGRGRPKAERKSETVQVAFGHGSSSSSIRSYGNPKRGGASGLGQKKEEEYKEPWDYYSDYPVRLPLRRPFLGNPELLDEEEFGGERANEEYDENSINSAEELGLLEESTDERMLFLQLPASLPLVKQSATGETSEADGTQKPSKPVGRLGKGCSLEELPAGFMGKLLVYKSGAVKLKIGDTLYNVSPGTNSVFVNDAVGIDTEAKQFCAVGELKRAIVTPDVDSLLRSMNDSTLD